MKNSEVRETYPDAVRSDWIDASILCDVVENDIEFIQFTDIDKNIVALDFVIDKLNASAQGSEVEHELKEILDVLYQIKEDDPSKFVKEKKWEQVEFTLNRIKAKSDNKSDYAHAIMDFFDLDNSFYVNGCVYKDMDDSLINYIVGRVLIQEAHEDVNR